MDELTQQNAALVEQATAASQAMAGQVRELNGMISRYDLGAQSAAPVAAPRSSAPPAPGKGRSEPRRAAGAGGEWIEV